MLDVILGKLFTELFNKITKVFILNTHVSLVLTCFRLIKNKGELNGQMWLHLLSFCEVSDVNRLQVKQILFKRNLTVKLLFRDPTLLTWLENTVIAHSHLLQIPQEQYSALIKANEQCLNVFQMSLLLLWFGLCAPQFGKPCPFSLLLDRLQGY